VISKLNTCKHCGDTIKHASGRLWHTQPPGVFPQYCRTRQNEDGSSNYDAYTPSQASDGGGWLHEPKGSLLP
jgi:hypothetical protein